MVEESRKVLLGSLQDVFATGQYSDLTITCGLDTYKAHRMIVCARSEFFAGASRFRGKTGANDKINLSDEEPAIVKLLMQYLYEGDYAPIVSDRKLNPKAPSHESAIPEWFAGTFPHSCGSYNFREGHRDAKCEIAVCPHHQCWNQVYADDECCQKFICSQCVPHPTVPAPTSTRGMSPADLLTHAKMYSIADRLLVAGLKALASLKFRHAAAVYHKDPTFLSAAEYIFNSTPETDAGLRGSVIATIAKNKSLVQDVISGKLLHKHSQFAMQAIIEQMAKELPEETEPEN